MKPTNKTEITGVIDKLYSERVGNGNLQTSFLIGIAVELPKNEFSTEYHKVLSHGNIARYIKENYSDGQVVRVSGRLRKWENMYNDRYYDGTYIEILDKESISLLHEP